eukprot:g3434.t1
MATLLQQNSIRFTKLHPSCKNLDIYGSISPLSYINVLGNLEKQESSISPSSKRTISGEYDVEELDLQEAGYLYSSQIRYARLNGGGGTPSTDTDSDKWPVRTSSSMSSKEKTLYKTELCRSWEETGKCSYGGKCQYAHGKEELRAVMRHPKFKTEVCCTFVMIGTCPYGRRCRFIHKNVPITAVGKQVSANLEQGDCLISCANSITASSRRLPIFIKLAKGLEE